MPVGQLQSAQILLIEPDPDRQRKVQASLEGECFVATACGSFEAARAEMRRSAFDLVIANLDRNPPVDPARVVMALRGEAARLPFICLVSPSLDRGALPALEAVQWLPAAASIESLLLSVFRLWREYLLPSKVSSIRATQRGEVEGDVPAPNSGEDGVGETTKMERAAPAARGPRAPQANASMSAAARMFASHDGSRVQPPPGARASRTRPRGSALPETTDQSAAAGQRTLPLRPEGEHVGQPQTDAEPSAGPGSKPAAPAPEDSDARGSMDDQFRQAQRIQALGTLSAGVAHDFNNLLTVISGWAEVASAVVPEGSKAAESMHGIIEAVEQASSITQSLLTFSRRSPLHKQSIAVGPLLEETVRLFRHMLSSELVFDVVIDEATSGEHIDVDRTQFQQVMLNLLMNAAEASDKRGRIRVSAERRPYAPATAVGVDFDVDGPWVVVGVADDGRGMPEVVRSRMFEPFFSTKQRGQGTGLGLSVVHGIVRDHEGWIDVSTRQQAGTAISIGFPLPRLAESAGEAGRQGAAGQVPCLAGKRALVVHPQRQICGIISNALEAASLEVHHANSWQAANQLLGAMQGVPDIIILHQNGHRREAQQWLLKLREGSPNLRVVLLPDGEWSREEEGWQGATSVTCVMPPFSLDALVRKVQSVLSSAEPV